MATFSDKIRLLRGLLNGERAHNGPLWAKFDITQRCNLRCSGCKFHSGKAGTKGKHLSVDLYKGLLRELKEMGTNTVTLSAEGEPFLHPEFSELISIASEAGFYVTSSTNGTLLGEENIRAVIGAGLDYLRVSFWASSPEEYVLNYPGTNPAYFERVKEGLKLLAGIKKETGSPNPRVMLHHPFNRNNHRGLDRLVEFAGETGCDGLTFAPFKCWSKDNVHLKLLEEEERTLIKSLAGLRRKIEGRNLKHNIDKTLLRYSVGPRVWEKYPCYMAWLHTRVAVDGRVLACHHIDTPMGDLKKESFREIWNNKRYRAFRRTALTKEGLAGVGGEKSCLYCGHLEENASVDRIFRWLSPFKRWPVSDTEEAPV